MYGCSRKRKLLGDFGECHGLPLVTAFNEVLHYSKGLAQHCNKILIRLLLSRHVLWLLAPGDRAFSCSVFVAHSRSDLRRIPFRLKKEGNMKSSNIKVAGKQERYR